MLEVGLIVGKFETEGIAVGKSDGKVEGVVVDVIVGVVVGVLLKTVVNNRIKLAEYSDMNILPTPSTAKPEGPSLLIDEVRAKCIDVEFGAQLPLPAKEVIILVE